MTLKICLEADWEHQTICIHEPLDIGLWWTLVLSNSIIVQGENRMAITITDLQAFSATIRPLDARGNPAPIDGMPTWSVSNEDALDLTVSTDGMTAEVVALGPLGNFQLAVTVDVRLGPEVLARDGILDITVVGSEATTIEIVPGVPYTP
jgi:hypothetical protein